MLAKFCTCSRHLFSKTQNAGGSDAPRCGALGRAIGSEQQFPRQVGPAALGADGPAVYFSNCSAAAPLLWPSPQPELLVMRHNARRQKDFQGRTSDQPAPAPSCPLPQPCRVRPLLRLCLVLQGGAWTEAEDQLLAHWQVCSKGGLALGVGGERLLMPPSPRGTPWQAGDQLWGC